LLIGKKKQVGMEVKFHTEIGGQVERLVLYHYVEGGLVHYLK